MGAASAAKVRGSATPLTVRPTPDWKPRTAVSVAGPKAPSTRRLQPLRQSHSWIRRTSAPRWPRRRTGGG